VFEGLIDSMVALVPNDSPITVIFASLNSAINARIDGKDRDSSSEIAKGH